MFFLKEASTEIFLRIFEFGRGFPDLPPSAREHVLFPKGVKRGSADEGKMFQGTGFMGERIVSPLKHPSFPRPSPDPQTLEGQSLLAPLDDSPPWHKDCFA
jgi:hypothetical protein